MHKIKLVIWDLDETFWSGTLSEEGIIPNQTNINLVKKLTSRGIINSIVSKNDFTNAKLKLESLKVWDYFIFPEIAWHPKGLLVKSVIENCQLRPENVLFLDDNHSNLEEVKFYNPGIFVKTPDFISQIINHHAFEGKNDVDHSRLNQYKLLEVKHSAKKSFSNNIDFLKSSNIRVSISGIDEKQIDRILELIERTNQLNFTKKRISKEDLYTILSNDSFENKTIQVRDKFGDYGIVGFYSLDKKRHQLEHFIFSCRILNLGIPQFIFSKLQFPKLKITPEIAENLDHTTPSWIKIESPNSTTIKNNNHDNSKKIRLFFKGGCDLDQILFYLDNNHFQIESETNYVSTNGFAIHQEHTQVLLDSYYLNDQEKKSLLKNKNIPFIDNKFYKTKIFDFNYDCLIISLLMDYTQEVYKHKKLNICIPYGGYYNLWDEKKNHDYIVDFFRKKGLDLKKETLQNFSNEFTSTGQISPSNFIKNLKKIRNLIPVDTPIIFLNGAELTSPHSCEKDSTERHIIMNKYLNEYVKKESNTFILDISKIVTNENQLTDHLRHYDRLSYRKISLELIRLLNEIFEENIELKINNKIKFKENIKSLIKTYVAFKRRILTLVKN